MYDAFSSDYDRFVNWDSRLAFEMPFLEKHLGDLASRLERPARVLDAACGTGMHAIALARRGYSAAGADLSAAMIEKARRNTREAGLEVPLAAAGFGGLKAAFAGSPLFPFDAVLCLGNSLPHLLTPDDLAAALADFAGCLGRGGLLILQNRNFDAVLAQHERWMEPQAYREDEREWIFLRFYDYDPDGLITFNIITLYRAGKEPWQQRVTSTRLYPQRREELAAALARAGFTEIQNFGSLAGASFDPVRSGNLVNVCRRG